VETDLDEIKCSRPFYLIVGEKVGKCKKGRIDSGFDSQWPDDNFLYMFWPHNDPAPGITMWESVLKEKLKNKTARIISEDEYRLLLID
jgi:hypothetical protein